MPKRSLLFGTHWYEGGVFLSLVPSFESNVSSAVISRPSSRFDCWRARGRRHWRGRLLMLRLLALCLRSARALLALCLRFACALLALCLRSACALLAPAFACFRLLAPVCACMQPLISYLRARVCLSAAATIGSRRVTPVSKYPSAA